MVRLLQKMEVVKELKQHDLHSSMVRLLPTDTDLLIAVLQEFTFQYGQIITCQFKGLQDFYIFIYIPVWSDYYT